MVIYVRTQGARIIKEGRHLLVKKGDATFHALFIYKLKQIVIYGNVDITHYMPLSSLCEIITLLI